MSWKIRRAAAKCLDAIIGTRHELLTSFYDEVSPVLISRFKEREETVKSDIFNVYITMLHQTRPLLAKQTHTIRSQMDLVAAATRINGKPTATTTPETTTTTTTTSGEELLVTKLRAQIGAIVKALQKLLKSKNGKTRQACFSLLVQLVSVLPGALAGHLAQIVPGVFFSLNDKTSTSNMKIDTLTFLNALLVTHEPKLFHPFLDMLVKPVVKCMQDSFYKIASDALLVGQQLAKILRSAHNDGGINCRAYIGELYAATLVRLRQTDIDQEVKERAIICTYVTCLSRTLVLFVVSN